jgi:shikimate kinase
MMGAGKSSVGRALERQTGLPRFDLDEMIVAKAGMSIPEIFASKGEDWFRELESQVLGELANDHSAIIVTGGGIVLRTANVERLKEFGRIIWLEAETDTLLERASRRGQRPLLQTEDPARTIAELLAKRTPLYENAADLRIDTTRLSHDEVAALILDDFEWQDAGR